MNRIIDIRDIDSARKELKKIEVSSQGIDVMAPKMIGACIKLEKVKLGAANILKQDMLAIGGEAAIARGVVNGEKEISDVILIGSIDRLKKLIKKLEYHNIFSLSEIKEDLKRFVATLLESKKQIIGHSNPMDITPTKIMGILNVTPDSFSDGGKHNSIEEAVERALEMERNGADVIDIGGESTRPGADEVSLAEEMERVIPVIKAIREVSGIPISIDTYKSQVAEKALEAEANIVNDISALQMDDSMASVLKDSDCPVILMHMLGTPKNMQKNPHYKDVVSEILDFFEERIEFCESKGISQSRLILDPGVGFGKRHCDNLSIINNLKSFKSLGLPVLLGTSRKSFINRIYPSSPDERLSGTLATTALACQNDINIVRVHDVLENYRFLQTLSAVRDEK